MCNNRMFKICVYQLLMYEIIGIGNKKLKKIDTTHMCDTEVTFVVELVNCCARICSFFAFESPYIVYYISLRISIQLCM